MLTHPTPNHPNHPKLNLTLRANHPNPNLNRNPNPNLWTIEPSDYRAAPIRMVYSYEGLGVRVRVRVRVRVYG